MRDIIYPQEFEEMMKHLTLIPNGDIVTAEGEVVGHADLSDDFYSMTAYAISIKGDTISRSALKESVQNYLENRKDILIWETDMLNLIDNAPTVSYEKPGAEPKYRWIKIFENEFCNGYKCPKCGHKIQCTEQGLQYFDTCEVCGADMLGDADE